MGQLISGEWHVDPLVTKTDNGAFVRKDSAFRNWVTADGEPGPSGRGGFKAEPGRYHLYVSKACPWAHRTMIFRALKGLEQSISISVVNPDMLDDGWTFQDAPGTVADPIFKARYLYQIYQQADPAYSGRVTVPVLWDKQRATIVSNESADIIRMFNSAFDQWSVGGRDYYPAALREPIDTLNARVYDTVNNGVYKCGFATTQSAYEAAFAELFDTLDMLDRRLGEHRYLLGNEITEADWRLFTTLVRFDPVYFGHFKCNRRRIADYANLGPYLLDLYQIPGVAGTTDLAHIKRHYYYSHATINPTRIVPLGPKMDLLAAHGRDRHYQNSETGA